MTRLFSLLTLLLFTLAATGCGSDARGQLSGKVIYNDQPVTGGTVIFATTGKNPETETAQIQSDGTYSTKHVPAGDVRVAVFSAGGGSASAMPPGVKLDIPPDNPQAKIYNKSPTNSVTVPPSFRDPATSNISVNVEAGKSKTFDIIMKDGK
jgi:hypothetical protein